MDAYIDLHLHTTKSDGCVSPQELLQQVKTSGLAAIAITDHDTLDGYFAAQPLAEELGIELIPGVELSCEEEGKDIHILAYCIDTESLSFKEYLQKFRFRRHERVYQITEKLQNMGINISADDVFDNVPGSSPGRLHIARAMVQKNIVRSTHQAFKQYIGEECPAYIKKMKLSVVECIELIHSIHGIAVLAHPAVYQKDHLIEGFIKNGLDGIEVFHSEHSISDSRKYKKIADAHNLVITGGSDYHGVAEHTRLLGSLKIPYKYVEALKKYHHNIYMRY